MNALPTEDRLRELAERAARNDLSESDQLELDRIVAADPAAAELIRTTREEVSTMQNATTDIIAGFDFERARNAIRERDRLHNRALLSMLLMIALCAIFWAVLVRSNWPMLVWIIGLPLTPVLLWSIWRWNELWRERRLLLARGEAVIPEIFESSRRSLLNEFNIVRVSVVVFTIALTVLAVESYINANYPRAIIVTVVVALLLATAGPSVFGKRARRRFERFATGDLTAEHFARGKDGKDGS